MKELFNDKLRRKIILVLNRYGARRVAVFGSFARDEAKKDSDLDILVELGENVSLLGLAGLKIELEEILKRKVDIVEYSTLHPLLKKMILKEKVPIL